MLFNQLNIGDTVHIIEVLGTFKKNTEYSTGTITSVSKVYDEPLQQGQFPMAGQVRRKVIDLVISSNGETKKFTVPEDRSIITDNTLGLTISTDKQEIANIIQNQYNVYKAKKESITKCDDEMNKCQAILNKLSVQKEDVIEDPAIKQLRSEIEQLKSLMQRKESQETNTTNTNEVG